MHEWFWYRNKTLQKKKNNNKKKQQQQKKKPTYKRVLRQIHKCKLNAILRAESLSTLLESKEALLAG